MYKDEDVIVIYPYVTPLEEMMEIFKDRAQTFKAKVGFSIALLNLYNALNIEGHLLHQEIGTHSIVVNPDDIKKVSLRYFYNTISANSPSDVNNGRSPERFGPLNSYKFKGNIEYVEFTRVVSFLITLSDYIQPIDNFKLWNAYQKFDPNFPTILNDWCKTILRSTKSHSDQEYNKILCHFREEEYTTDSYKEILAQLEHLSKSNP